MEFAITGSLGHISKPLAEALLRKGHSVTIISSQIGRKADIEAIGAAAAIGDIKDANFLSAVFRGKDAAYCMLPPPRAFTEIDASTRNFNFLRNAEEHANAYADAITQSAIARVVHLSSVGAHHEKGTGFIRLHYLVEKILDALPPDVSVIHSRPVGFYYNLFGFIDSIRESGMIASNYGGPDIVQWVAPVDIAAAVAREIENPARRRTAPYVASDELACDETARILGAAIRTPNLKWIRIADEQLKSNLISAGMSELLAKDYVELNASIHTGILYEDYYQNRPPLGVTKMTAFAADFAGKFNAL